jgi:hypothetical protein
MRRYAMQPPEHDFTLTAEQWDRAVIGNAAYFTTIEGLAEADQRPGL